MTEEELRGSREYLLDFIMQHESDRKRLLALCAFCRPTWDYVTMDRNREALEASERYADGEMNLLELEERWRRARYEPVVYEEWDAAVAGPAIREARWPAHMAPKGKRDEAARRAFHAACPVEVRSGWFADQIAFMRDVFGLLDTGYYEASSFRPAWRSGAAVALAREMHESRDFSAMPVLADALLDAGCDSEQVLAHCRGPGPHARGCWAVDLVLGKE
jgi:hypothetical protein